MKKFYDTSALLEKTNSLFKDDEEIIISTTVLEELENIKTSNKKDEHIKKSAKKIIRLLNENKDKYEVIIFSKLMLKPLVKKGISLDTYDMNILAAVIYCDTHLYPDNVMFITNDLSLQNIANLFLGEDSISEV